MGEKKKYWMGRKNYSKNRLEVLEYTMVNRTDKVAKAIHGTNPQRLIDYTVRKKIYDSLYWKKNCFGLSAEILIDKAMDLKYIGGTYGGYRKPTEFICLILKMLQIQLDDEIITELIKNEDFKYLRLLGAFYLRLTGNFFQVIFG